MNMNGRTVTTSHQQHLSLQTLTLLTDTTPSHHNLPSSGKIIWFQDGPMSQDTLLVAGRQIGLNSTRLEFLTRGVKK